MTKLQLTVLTLAGIWAGLMLGSSLDNETRLIECVQETEGTDTDCDQCYYEIYGEYPND